MTLWTTPISWPRGLLASSAIMNQQIRDNQLHLKEQVRAALSQPATFTRTLFGTHPSADQYANKILLRSADYILVADSAGSGEAISIASPMVADITSVGLNGLDTGFEEPSAWYEIYVIRKPADGSVGLLLHKYSEGIVMDASIGPTGGASQDFRKTSSDQKVAQSFQLATLTGVKFVYALLYLSKVGAPTGNVWVTIETDSGGSPSGTAIATSPSYAVADLPTGAVGVPVVFYADGAGTTLLNTGVTYHAVLNSDVAVNASNYLSVYKSSAAYALGECKSYNGTAWTAVGADLFFGINVRKGPVALTMPSGFDQKCLIGYVFNNSSSAFRKFQAFDKVVTPWEAAVIVGPGGAVLPEIVAVPTPAIPIRAQVVISGAAAAFVAMGPIRGGFTVSNVPRVNGQVVWNSSAAGMETPGVLNTDLAQAVLRSSSAGTASVWLSTWEWF